MFRSKLGELWRTWVLGKQYVGIDKNANKYYMWKVIDGGEEVQRREVQLYKPPRDIADYDPDAIPIEWRSWLTGHRQVAPTAEELQKLEEYRQRVKERAKLVDAEEEKRRLRGQVLGKKVEGPDMSAFLRQLGEKSSREGGEKS